MYNFNFNKIKLYDGHDTIIIIYQNSENLTVDFRLIIILKYLTQMKLIKILEDAIIFDL